MPHTLIILPTYNEALNIKPIIKSILSQKIRTDILVVDDNSPDGTAQIVKDNFSHTPHVNILHRPQKSGLAQAYSAGFHWALSQHYTYIVQMDADFSHDPHTLPTLIHEAHNHDLVIGSRYIPNGNIQGWSPLRLAISKVGNLYASLCLNVPIHDLTGGFNVWSRKALYYVTQIPLTSEGYGFQIELKYRAVKLGLSISEVPITFKDRTKGKSKMKTTTITEALLKIPMLRFKKYPTDSQLSILETPSSI